MNEHEHDGEPQAVTPAAQDAAIEPSAPAAAVNETANETASENQPMDEAASASDAAETPPLPGDLAEIQSVLEAALLIAGEAIPAAQLARLFEPALDGETVRKLLGELKEAWQGRKIELVQVASGWRFQGVPAMQTHLARLSPEKPPRYSRAIMETLAIIAYQQPVTRGDIEAIRGVAVSTNVIKTLEDRQWIEAVGQRETPGRPTLYATTKAFLDDLGLRSLAELPPLAELDSSHLLEMPDAPTKAAEAALALASPLLGNADAAAEPGAARDQREPSPSETQTLH
jgi:segregation and condensation protein B